METSGRIHWPKFAQVFPKDPELERLVEYFVRGNHRRVRDEAEALAHRTTDPTVAAAALALRARLRSDPIAYVLLATTALLLASLTIWSIHRSHAWEFKPVKVTPKSSG